MSKAWGCGFLFVVASTWCAQVLAETPIIGPKDQANPFFNEVVFHTRQDEIFSAISKLSTLRSSPVFSKIGPDAELLLAQLYVAYGLHEEAETILNKMVYQDVDQDARDMAWMLLAKQRYKKGEYFEAEQALAKIQNTFSWQLQEERDSLRSFLLLKQKRYRQAITVLRDIQSRSDWAQYAKYNLGIALLQEGRKEEGVSMLRAVNNYSENNQEMVELKEQSLLLLGDLHLREEAPKEAAAYYEKISLDGASSSKALLGIGWAYYMMRDYEGAVLPWMALFERGAGDSAVQEGVLAVPYTYTKLGDYKQAQRYYQLALTMYQLEQTRLNAAVLSVKSGKMLDTLMESGLKGQTGWSWELTTLPALQEGGYLAGLFASNLFQEAARDYQDMVFLKGKLDAFQEKLEIFGEQLDKRKGLFEYRLPRIMQIRDAIDLSEWRRQQRDLNKEVNRANDQNDVSAFATSQEHTALERLYVVEQALAQMPDSEKKQALHSRYEMLRGVASWGIHSEFKQRVLKMKKLLIELDDAIGEVAGKKLVFSRLQGIALDQIDRYKEKQEKLLAAISPLRMAVNGVAAELKLSMENEALSRLSVHQQRLDNYVAQAAFASAQIFELQQNTVVGEGQ